MSFGAAADGNGLLRGRGFCPEGNPGKREVPEVRVSKGTPVSLSTGWGLSFILATLNGSWRNDSMVCKLGTRQEKWAWPEGSGSFSSWCLRISGELWPGGVQSPWSRWAPRVS